MGLAARRLEGLVPPFDLVWEVIERVKPAVAPARPAGEVSIREVGDAELIARCQASDRAALGELYRRHRTDAMRFIRHAARGTQDADDILQEVFLEVAGSIRSFAGRSSFPGWLRSICVRTALRHMKRRHRQIGDDDKDAEGRASRDLLSTDDPGEGFERRERARRIGRLLETIAPKKRMVLLLHDFEGVSPKEISELVGAPVLTVRTRLFYARKELASLATRDPMLAHDLRPWLAERGGTP